MLDDFLQFLRSNQLYHPQSKMLLAVSGGVDSVVLCRLFHEAGLPFGIAHCNFRLRGAEADEDESFVAELAKDFKVESHAERFDTQAYATKNRISIQMAARDLRYEWLEKIRSTKGYLFIATAHHLNDSIETLLLNLTKGTGISGLHGILPKNQKLIRPLLFATREQIEKFAAGHKVRFREDASNESLKYQRNRIRHTVIPALRQINPGLEQSLEQTIQTFRHTESIYRFALEQIRDQCMNRQGDEIFIPIRKLLKMPGYPLVLEELLKPYGFTRQVVSQLCEQLTVEQAGKMYYSPTHRVLKDRRFLILAAKDTRHITNYFIPDGQAQLDLEGLRLSIRTVDAKGFRIPKAAKFASLDLRKIKFPLQIRRWRKGDYFYPYGLTRKNSDKPGKKKLSDFFVDQKLNLLDKEKAWVLLSGQQIVWVVGYRIDDRFKFTSNTKKILLLEKIDA